MTVLKATSLRPARRHLPNRAASRHVMLLGLAAGLLAAFGGVNAAQSPLDASSAVATQAAPASSMDPAKQLPGAISVSNIDFKRGDGGAGRLILHFSGDGASPDLQTQGSSVIVNVGNARLPA